MAETRMTPTRPADDYRRAARRLRATLGHDRPRLYRSLQSLSNRKPRPTETPDGPAARYANLVAQSLDATVLRYSERLKLLRVARHFHIDRFEANLIIAAVQHRTKAVQSVEVSPRSQHGWMWVMAIFLVLQSVIALGAWKLLHT